MSPHLQVASLQKNFGRLQAVDNVSFDVNQGELITLLGPSGCGKSTTLRLIAGLERPDGGEISLNARVVASSTQNVFTPPEKRGIGMVFQNYAVWPHMTVFQNVVFPLQARRVPAGEARRRTMAVLETVGLASAADRPAPMLSGGQQQRVALARALVCDPEVLLLDEPFSNLDARLRDDMRLQLRDVQRRLGVTSVFVTHDQTEAMMLSDRVLVMHSGRVEQAGSPQEVYESPRSQFVMDFLGQVNHLTGTLVELRPAHLLVRLDHGEDVTLPARAGTPGLKEGERVVLAFRSADAEVTTPQAATWPGSVASVVYMGGREEYVVKMGEAEIRCERGSAHLPVGAQVAVKVSPEAIRVWPA